MKIAVFGPEKRVGLVQDGQIIDVNRAYAKYLREKTDEPLPHAMAAAVTPADLDGFIRSGKRALEATEKAAEYLSKQAQDPLGPQGEAVVQQLSSVRLHPPLTSRAARIMTAGGNFADHLHKTRVRRFKEDVTLEQVREDARKRGIWGFWKIAQHTTGTDEDMIYPARTQRLDYEGEVAVVLGNSLKDVNESQAEKAFWGYTLHNDWSARDQHDLVPYNFAAGKNFDTSSSLGPWIVVGEIKDPQSIPFETRVSGQVRQQGNTKDMIFSFAEFIAYMSRDMTLLPGDLLSGGTCEGTAMDSSDYDESGMPKPELFAKPGDVVEISSPAIGTLRNRVVAKQ